MDLKTIKIKEIKPSPYNPRQITKQQLDKLRKNIEIFGLVDPIIINLKNNHIIGGHQRFTVLQEKYPDNDQSLNLLRMGNIGWVFDETSLEVKDENHEKALNLSLNRLDGEFTDDVGSILDELAEAHFDLDLTGFEDYEIVEATLPDVDDLQVFQDKHDNKGTTEVSDDTSISDNPSAYDTTQYSIDLAFHSWNQRNKFLSLLQRLKKEDTTHQKTITQLFLEYLQSNYTNDHEVIPNYTLLFETIEERDEFNKICEKIEANKVYERSNLYGFIEENETQ